MVDQSATVQLLGFHSVSPGAMRAVQLMRIASELASCQRRAYLAKPSRLARVTGITAHQGIRPCVRSSPPGTSDHGPGKNHLDRWPLDPLDRGFHRPAPALPYR